MFDKKQKKGQMGLGQLIPVALTFVIVGILLAFGALILSDVDADMPEGTAEDNLTEDAVSGLSKIGGKLPLIGTVIAAGIIITIIVGAFVFKRMNQ